MLTKISSPNYYYGPRLLENPLLNKGSAFSFEERMALNLLGLLPSCVETIAEQTVRAYAQYLSCNTNLAKHIFLRSLQDNNEILFYNLINNHLNEMLPVIYTPVVGEACQHFSDIYRRSRGIFISYDVRNHLDTILRNCENDNVRVIVVTDGERILGLGDQGIGGMGIPIGKLSLYTSCGGINPAHTLPIILDVGTNNKTLINDPLYMGYKHPRITGEEYYEFIHLFIKAVMKRWPNVLLQFEDFAQSNAMPLLEHYRNKLCCFNDDIQGTAAVTLGCLLAACRATGTKLSEQRLVFVGAGSAGCGIAEYVITQMVYDGLSEEEARSNIYMVDKFGLLTDDMPNLLDFQKRLAINKKNIQGWPVANNEISLLEVIENVAPTILIGISGQSGLFSEQVIRKMYSKCKQPIIMPLSNPTSCAEALPQDIISWSEGSALIATGSPFDDVEFNGKKYAISQCNNAYIFPGLGLGVLASEAKRVTDKMLLAASKALADLSPLAKTCNGSLLPYINEIQQVSKVIALAVAQAAQLDGVAPETTSESLHLKIESEFWQPEYHTYIGS
ncbi:hypothetical protein T637_24345 [Enterobacter hormaechei subsp. hoffmannii]|uniref:NAD-dependent malic enzyme n=1 Tax=Enterobacter hormaechei TaxID=158836 RepID=UPI00062796D4|nr:NAD-dependent malic enzyme [Enterobacter hormaechei]KKJ19116.1 hypothetical protein T637_24345 [Enterobacter hormaechei subsp. hoffmannii]